jgi:hypothetical protein
MTLGGAWYQQICTRSNREASVDRFWRSDSDPNVRDSFNSNHINNCVCQLWTSLLWLYDVPHGPRYCSCCHSIRQLINPRPQRDPWFRVVLYCTLVRHLEANCPSNRGLVSFLRLNRSKAGGHPLKKTPGQKYQSLSVLSLW